MNKVLIHLLSLLGYMLVYLIIFPTGVALMIRIVRQGPSHITTKEPIEGGQPRDPFVVAPEYSAHDH